MLFNALAGQLITTVGWRQTYRVLGIIAFCILVPVCWLVVRTRPSDLGLLPYGQEKENGNAASFDDRGMTVQEVVHTGRFWALCLVTALGNISLCALNQTANRRQYLRRHAGRPGLRQDVPGLAL